MYQQGSKNEGEYIYIKFGKFIIYMRLNILNIVNIISNYFHYFCNIINNASFSCWQQKNFIFCIKIF